MVVNYTRELEKGLALVCVLFLLSSQAVNLRTKRSNHCSVPVKNALHSNATPNKGNDKKKREGETSKNVGNPSVPGDPLLSRGPSRPSPGGHLPTPLARRLRRWDPFFSPISPCAAMWGGRCAAAGGPVAFGSTRC